MGKGGKKVAFIAFSDIQIKDWALFSKNHSRLKHSMQAMRRISQLAIKYQVPILFAGDFFDNNKEIDNRTLGMAIRNYKKTLGELEVIGISGNHDQGELSTPSHYPVNYMTTWAEIFDNFHLVDFSKWENSTARVQGIPYLTNNVGFSESVNKARSNRHPTKKNILLVHTDFHHIAYNKVRTSGTVENLDMNLGKLFKGFDLVLSGHIHAPAKIRHNIYMLGATNHQRTSDLGVDMGIWKVYEDMSMSFIKLDLPQFKRGEPKDDIHFYLPEVQMKSESEEKDLPNKSISPLELAKEYLRHTDQKSKKKLNILNKYINAAISQ